MISGDLVIRWSGDKLQNSYSINYKNSVLLWQLGVNQDPMFLLKHSTKPQTIPRYENPLNINFKLGVAW